MNGRAVAAGPKTPKEFVNGNGLSFNPDWLKRNGYDRISDLKELYPRIETEKWEKIAFPKGKIGNAIKDSGKAPGTPGELSASTKHLSWGQATGDVIGYRIYRASSKGSSFSLIDHTTSKQYSLPGPGVYQVKAVDYFGRESASSNTVQVGGAKDKPEKYDDKTKDKKNKDQKDQGDQKKKADKKKDKKKDD
ncbi:hypothetical protein RWE15_25315 [Virgibacillus halophilus]|uniref:Uncharacterized protein n=1 Tax=Tigheibacillus halophilus TaxID=361280 RepID=A0ABU5CCQ2_9BACI|nr:hypothetical protein [Virgibacillus halophilus]